MTNKTTKKALLASSISLLLCVAMLIGSTFAWFTDSASSKGNKIMAGNLDVELFLHNGAEYVNISDDEKPIFGEGSIAQNNNAETLWEPGKTQVAYLMIKNEGNLDLKYRVDVNVENVEKNLYEVMEYAIIPDAQNGEVTSWTSGTSVKEGVNPTGFEDVSLGAGKEHYFALAIHMKEEANNDYMNGIVNFDIIVNATQLNSEYDSFGNIYDKDSSYTPIARTKRLSNNATISNSEGDVILGKEFEIDTTGSKMGMDLGVVKLDTAFQFEPALSLAEAELSEYKDWHADFVVSVDKDITEYNSIALTGYYDAWCSLNNDKWVALSNENFLVDAGDELRLVAGMGNITVSFEELSEFGNDGIGFLCGAVELGDKLPANTTLKVELRLFEATGGSIDTETGNYITIGSYSHTFA